MSALLPQPHLFLLSVTGLDLHCVKSVQIRSFFWSIFSRIRTGHGDFLVNLRIQSECRKILTRKNSVFGHFSRSVIDSVLHLDVKTSCGIPSNLSYDRKLVSKNPFQ